MTISRRVLAVASAAAIVGVGLAGCSSTQSDPAASQAQPPQGVTSASPAAFIAQAADSTRSAGSAKLTSTTTIGGMGEQGTAIRADGVVDFAGNEAALRVSSSLFGGSSDMQVILADGKSYLQVPMFGEKWIAMPIEDLGLNLADPAQGLDMLKKMTDLQEVGQEPIEGVEATKYTGTVDLKDAVGQAGLPAGTQQELSKELDKLSGQAQVTVWVDDDGRIIRFDQSASHRRRRRKVGRDHEFDDAVGLRSRHRHHCPARRPGARWGCVETAR